jgi:glycine/D-amino acid oxidase-like deaminating enzyme
LLQRHRADDYPHLSRWVQKIASADVTFGQPLPDVKRGAPLFPPNSVSEPCFGDSLPDAVDVAVIGGGVIGIAAAWYLLERGFSVLVCDKGRVAGEQSSRNWGWVRVTGRDPDEVPIAIDSLRCWEAISKTLPEPTGFTRQGIIALAGTEGELDEYAQWLDVAKAHGLDSVVLNTNEVKKHLRLDHRGWKGALYTPSDARAEPFLAVPALARGVQARGGIIREYCAVRTIEQQAGRVSSVVTEAGEVSVSAAILAGGVWSSLFLNNMGIRFPQLGVRGTVLRTHAAPDIFPGALGLHDLFLRRRQDGGYTVATGITEHCVGWSSVRFGREFRHSLGSASELALGLGKDVTQRGLLSGGWQGDQVSVFEKHRVLDPTPSKKGIETIQRRLRQRAPELADLGVAQAWAGMIDATPDVVPVMDAIDTVPGLFLATGFSGHGFGIGPGAGKVMAAMVAGDSVDYDLSRFRFNRFADGSPIRPGPAI